VSRSSVVGRWRRRGGVNPLASAPLLIGLRVRVCGGAVGTTNVGSRAPAYLTFYMALREGGHCHKRQEPPIRARLGSGNRSGDRSREITFLTFSPLISTSYLYLDNPLIHKSVYRAHCIMTVSYVLSDTMTTIHLSVSKQILV
jgi:hypothetical protein